MKKQLLAIGLLLATIQLNAQQETKKSSNIEAFSSKTGSLMFKEYISIGKVNEVKIDVLYVTDMLSSDKQSGLRLEYQEIGKYTSSTKLAILDKDEVDALIASIKTIQEKIFPLTSENYTEVNFVSRSGFTAGCFLNKGRWDTFIKLERFDSGSFVPMSKEKFAEFLRLIESAKEKL